MTKVTNISGGPRGIWSHGGADGDGNVRAGELVMLDSGKSADVDLMPGEEPGDWFTFDATNDGPPALSGMNKADLLEQAAAEGVEIEDGATKADIIAAIELAREAAD